MATRLSAYDPSLWSLRHLSWSLLEIVFTHLSTFLVFIRRKGAFQTKIWIQRDGKKIGRYRTYDKNKILANSESNGIDPHFLSNSGKRKTSTWSLLARWSNGVQALVTIKPAGWTSWVDPIFFVSLLPPIGPSKPCSNRWGVRQLGLTPPPLLLNSYFYKPFPLLKNAFFRVIPCRPCPNDRPPQKKWGHTPLTPRELHVRWGSWH